MSNNLIELKGEIKGVEEITSMLHAAPKVMRSTVHRGFNSIKKKYVGSTVRKRGQYTSYLMGRKLRRRSGTWSEQAARTFKGIVVGRDTLDNMTLVMGVKQKSQSKYAKGLIGMEQGGVDITSSKWMPIPIIDKLESQYGTKRNYIKIFRELLLRKDITSIRSRDNIIFADKEKLTKGESLYSAALFIGKKKTRTNKYRFNFEERFKNLFDKETVLMSRRIDRTIRALEKGYLPYE